MDASPNTYSKTVPPRRFGLSRSHGGNSFITPKKTTLEVAQLKKTPDTKDTSFKSNDITPTGTVPKPSKSKNKQILPITSNSNVATVSSRPNKDAYKLSLCKATTEIMTRKRVRSLQAKSQIQSKRLKLDQLGLKLDNNLVEESERNENCDTEEPSSDHCGTTSEENEMHSDSSSLQKVIDELKHEITKTEKHHRKVAELQSLIEKWREAGLKTIEQLEEALGGDAKAILDHYNIHPALFKLDLSQ